MDDGEVVLNQVNVVVPDVTTIADFLGILGLGIPTTLPDWMRHHRTVESTVPGFDVDLDSSAFAAEWGGLPVTWTGVVLGVSVSDRESVDAIYARALAAGASCCRAPYDAFWGSRHAVVEGPDGVVVGLMSPAEEHAATSPPDPPATV